MSEHIAEVRAIDAAEEPVARAREFEDRDAPAGARDADHLGEARVGVGDVAEAKSNGHDLKRVVREGESLGVGLDEANGCARLGGLPRAQDEHLAAEVGGHDRDRASRGAVVGQCKVASAGAKVEDGPFRGRSGRD